MLTENAEIVNPEKKTLKDLLALLCWTLWTLGPIGGPAFSSQTLLWWLLKCNHNLALGEGALHQAMTTVV